MRIVCSRVGSKYSVFQVERLYSECRAWLDFDEFWCVTDGEEPLHPDIKTVTIPKGEQWRTWWSKIYQFECFKEGKTVSLDIDCHIRDSVVFQFSTDHLLMQKDPLALYHPHKDIKYVNSSVITYDGDFSWVSNKYLSDWQNFHRRYRGDQEFMWGELRENIRYHSPIFESFKWAARDRGYSTLPIVNYHGEDVKASVG